MLSYSQRMLLLPVFVLSVCLVASLVPNVAAAQTEEAAAEPKEKLIVATRQVPPFAIQDDAGDWSGIAIELLRAIVADFNAEENSTVAIEFRDLPLAELLSQTENGDVDLAIAALTVNFEREERLDFSHPFFASGLAIAVRAERSSGWFHVFDRLFSWALLEVLATLGLMLLLAGFLMYLAERKSNKQDFGGGAWRGIGAGFWWSIVTLTTVGYGDKAPKTTLGRAIAAIWMLSGLLIIASFTAAMTSALTVGQIRSRIAGPTDLARVTSGTVAESTSEAYLMTHRYRSRPFNSLEEALNALEAGRVTAVVYDEPLLRYAVREGNRAVSVLPSIFDRQDYAIALPSDSLLRERVNRSLLRVTSQPFWDDLVTRYLGVRE